MYVQKEGFWTYAYLVMIWISIGSKTFHWRVTKNKKLQVFIYQILHIIEYTSELNLRVHQENCNGLGHAKSKSVPSVWGFCSYTV